MQLPARRRMSTPALSPGAQQSIRSSIHHGQSSRRQRQHRRSRRDRRHARRLHVVHAGAVYLRGVAIDRTQSAAQLPRDFIPIGYTAENPMFVAVNPKLGVSTLPQLIALAKKEPDKISIAVTGAGRLTDLTGLLLQDRAGVQLLRVPYTGGPAAALADVGSGRVSMIIEGYSGIVGAVKAGQVKLIAVASPERLPQFPDCRRSPKRCRASAHWAGKCWWHRTARRRRLSARSAMSWPRSSATRISKGDWRPSAAIRAP